jgi:hypothetical protein
MNMMILTARKNRFACEIVDNHGVKVRRELRAPAFKTGHQYEHLGSETSVESHKQVQMPPRQPLTTMW